MKKVLIKLLLVVTSTSLLGCAELNNQDVGTISGGVIGGLVGSQFGGGSGQLVAIGAGTLVGAYLGGSIGKSMDDADRARMTVAFERNANGQPTYWQNQRTGAAYTVVPIQNVDYHGNRYCREYRSTANIAGKKEQVYGTACRQPDGSWKIVNSH